MGEGRKEPEGLAGPGAKRGTSRGPGRDAPGFVQERLTERETEILQLVADGMVSREIAEKLMIAPETVKTHMHHILAKLQARSRAHAVTIGFRSRLID
jgi:DNA-binding CsgD family transcriptional regulator